jgi:integrase/recombinase XerD
MPKKGARKPKVAVGDPNDPEGLYVWMKRFLEALRVKNYSPRTVENRESYLGFFIAWCEARSIGRPQEVTKPILERYQRHLFHLRKPDGKPLSFRAQYARLVPVRAYFKWLTRQNALLWNPASELELPRIERRLPRFVLSVVEAEQVLEQPNVNDAIGLRDRAIIEVLYSTGIRRMEVLNLSIYDLDTERGTLMVRQGKGKKDRMVPIGERAIAWLERYLGDARPGLVVPPDDGTLFLGATGEELSPNRLTQLVRGYVDAAELGKRGSCHLFRHTMATLMLENGADIRYIQEMLGHAELSTTQIYTQVSIRRLKQVHTLTHPGAKLGSRDDGDGVAEAAAVNADDVEPLIEQPSVVKANVTAEELMVRLADEDDEDGYETDDIAAEAPVAVSHGR